MRGFWNSSYIDFWSIPHFLFGVLLGQAVRSFGIHVGAAAIAMILIAVLWELFEVSAGIPEEKSNGVTDVVLSVLGFVLIVWIAPLFTDKTEVALFWWILVIWLVLNVGGFALGGWRSWFRSEMNK